MEAGGGTSVSLVLLGKTNNNGGGSCCNESSVSKVVEGEDGSYDAELELGLGLSIGGGCGKSNKGSAWGECGRILTAKDFPSVVPQSIVLQRGCNSTNAVNVSGTKRAAEPVSHEGGSPTSGSQVIGWPPIRAYRMNSLVNQAKSARPEEDNRTSIDKDQSKEVLKKKICNGNKSNANGNEKGNLGFVKVNMDGIPIGRKVDLNAHTCYENLAQTLEEMFFRSSAVINPISGDKKQVTKQSKLLDGSSDFVLTYEDKEGDWMLVGDVPWGMFLNSVKRFRIMRTSEANGLAPRFQESNERQRSKPV